jgi:hypothetical protein
MHKGILMARLSIGDRVLDVSGTHEGRLIEIEGRTGYVLQPNGVEIEFPLEKLKPYEEPEVAVPKGPAGSLRDQALTAAQRALLASVPKQIWDAVAQSYDKGADPGSRQAFAELSDDKKLKTIRIYLPSLPQHLLRSHLKLVVAFRDLAKTPASLGKAQ